LLKGIAIAIPGRTLEAKRDGISGRESPELEAAHLANISAVSPI
jgi:hypothetical protein